MRTANRKHLLAEGLLASLFKMECDLKDVEANLKEVKKGWILAVRNACDLVPTFAKAGMIEKSDADHLARMLKKKVKGIKVRLG